MSLNCTLIMVVFSKLNGLSTTSSRTHSIPLIQAPNSTFQMLWWEHIKMMLSVTTKNLLAKHNRKPWTTVRPIMDRNQVNVYSSLGKYPLTSQRRNSKINKMKTLVFSKWLKSKLISKTTLMGELLYQTNQTLFSLYEMKHYYKS